MGAAATATRRRRQRVSPGRWGYERTPITPRERLRVAEHPPAREPFSARRTLRRAGAASATLADRGAASTAAAGRRAGGELMEPTQEAGVGVGALLVTVGASILGLALLENLLGGRGPAAFGQLLGMVGGGIEKLVDPTDPIIRQGQPPPPPASSTSTTTRSSSSAPAASPVPGAIPGAGGRLTYPAMTRGGADPWPYLQFTANADWQHVDLWLLDRLNDVGRRLGKVITVFSGYRSPSYSASVGGYANDPHTRGVAVDAWIGSTPIGSYGNAFAVLKSEGLESGAQPNFYNGQPDPTHVQFPGSGVNKLIHAATTWATRGRG
jgi:hypothetical protein